MSDRAAPLVDPYDIVPYPGEAYPDTHPDRLATMGLLHGLEPAPVETCRVLEVGCSEGANLIPMAYAIPSASFVGFDLAEIPVARANRRIEELGLKNIRIFQGDLTLELDLPMQFDYIIAHGVYAWVPPAVQDSLLALCRKLLAPQGIAFVSYNCLPGSYIRHWMRDLMLLAPGGNDAKARMESTLGIMQWIAQSRPQDDPYRKVLEAQAERLQGRNPFSVFHDELSEAFTPCSFPAFLERAAAHHLRYVSESSFPPPNDPSFKPEMMQMASALGGGDPVRTEGALDMVRMRMFRETLLCHEERNTSHNVDLSALQKLSFTSSAAAGVNEATGEKTYTLPGGLAMESRHADTIGLMDLLISSSPETVPFTVIHSQLSTRGVVFDQGFFTQLFRLVVAKMIDAHAWSAPVSRSIGPRPAASRLAQDEYRRHRRMTSLWHRNVKFSDPVLEHCLQLADGTRTRAELVDALHAASPQTGKSDLTQGIEAALQTLNVAGALHA